MFQGAMISLVGLLLALSSGDCPYGVNHAWPISAKQAIPSDTHITLERTGCEGACPIYTLKISADGVVVYEGKQFVRKTGKVESKITREQLRQLISEFDKANYFSLRDKYQSARDGCPSGALDYPSAITSITINGRSKTISHDYGCREKSPGKNLRQVYPKELFELEQRIDEIAGTKQWLK